jgi:hypothetical protein
MPPTDPATILVLVPEGDSLGDTMNQIRSWLDSNKVQPSVFKPVSGGRDRAYAIAFSSVEDAARFRLHLLQSEGAPRLASTGSAM